MALLPENNITIGNNVQIITEPSYTYYIDFKNKRIVRNTDGKEAMIQAIFKILKTERYAYLIYDWNYGIELEGLIGKDNLFVIPEIERRIKESLLQDDRIISLVDFNIIQNDNNDFLISFTANTTEGEVDINTTINL